MECWNVTALVSAPVSARYQTPKLTVCPCLTVSGGVDSGCGDASVAIACGEQDTMMLASKRMVMYLFILFGYSPAQMNLRWCYWQIWNHRTTNGALLQSRCAADLKLMMDISSYWPFFVI